MVAGDDSATLFGVSRPLLTFLACLLSSIPAAALVPLLPTPSARHAYNVAVGAATCWFAYGGMRASVAIWGLTLASYAAMCALPRWLSGHLVFLATFSFLILSHVTSLDASAWRRGDIDFTGTLMIVTLKLVSAAMDYHDGANPRTSSTSPTPLPRLPALLPFLGFVFFPAALLVGPPFPYAAYDDYIEGRGLWASLYPQQHLPPPGSPPFPPRLLHALKALVKALLCLAAYHTLSQLLPPSALLQPAFFSRSFPARYLHVALTLFAYRWMFYFIWAVAEAALILSAFGFSGFKATKNSQGKTDGERRDGGRSNGQEGEGGQKQQQLEADWSMACNAHMWVVEVTGSAAQLATNWNIGVSRWLRTYVYDRMTPPSGKASLTTLLITQAVSALWHGLHPGYYLFFLSAAIAQDASKLLHRLYQSIPPHRHWQRRLAWLAQVLYTRVLVGYAPLGFILLRADLTFRVWRSLYFVGSVLPLVLSALLPPLIPPPKRQKKDS
ncbi:hypothetical protein CLOM_g22340 [Closterium sp. NIES-68]|nr:hypothetical protein CLOM_g22340 [Closterium sp. NIES-68]GJP76164.1 hypothetical protein CLOP_g6535 [Closterium sp. NIES-67]